MLDRSPAIRWVRGTSGVTASVVATIVATVPVVANDASAQEVLYTLESPNAEYEGYFGYPVSAAGDVNGDGCDDVIVGAHTEDTDTTDAGRAYVVSGCTGQTLPPLKSPNAEFQGYFGYSASGAGDVDGDGYDDLIVGAYQEDADSTDAGRAYVFSGQTGSEIYTLVSPNEERGGYFGASVSGAGDVNSNGHDDMIVGASLHGPTCDYVGGEDRAYIFSGQNGEVIHTLVSPNEQPAGSFGSLVSRAGDVNKDGYDDVIVGAWREAPGNSPWEAGRAYVFSGQTGDTLYGLASPNEEGQGHFGCSVDCAGDVNADGHPDVIVGADLEGPPGSPQYAGRAFVFDGPTGALLHTLVSPNEEALGVFGFWVSGAGDVSDDGYDDLLVGAFVEDPGASPADAGRAYVFSGQTGDWMVELASPNETDHADFGISVAGVGDMNGDGRSDVVVGAVLEDGGAIDAGRAYVLTFPQTSASDSAGVEPRQLALAEPIPNPTDADIRLRVRILGGAVRRTELGLYDPRGRLIATLLDEPVRGGDNLSLCWTVPAELSPGVYWWRLTAGEESVQRPMVLVR
jgi:hypothetical protein